MRNKKILIVGKKNHLGWYEHSIGGANQIDDLFVDTFTINQSEILYQPIKVYLKIFKSKEEENRLISFRFEQKLKKFKPDLILFISGFFIPIELYQVAKQYNIDVASWVGDKFGENVKEFTQYIDKLYVSDTGLLEIGNNIGFKNISFLQFGYNNLLHKNYKLKRDDYINFVGSFTQERNDILKEMQDSKIHLEGINWDKLEVVSPHWIVNNHKISQKKVVNIYNTTLATLNIGQNTNIINMVNMRTFEAVACGSCLITDNLKDIEYCFEPNYEVLVYDNQEELQEITERFNNDKQFIKTIATNGYNRLIKSNITYKDRILSILADFK